MVSLAIMAHTDILIEVGFVTGLRARIPRAERRRMGVRIVLARRGTVSGIRNPGMEIG